MEKTTALCTYCVMYGLGASSAFDNYMLPTEP
jgi:hypothetical protein